MTHAQQTEYAVDDVWRSIARLQEVATTTDLAEYAAELTEAQKMLDRINSKEVYHG